MPTIVRRTEPAPVVYKTPCATVRAAGVSIALTSGTHLSVPFSLHSTVTEVPRLPSTATNLVPFTVATAGVDPVVKFNIIYGVGLNLKRESPLYKLLLLVLED